MYSYFVPIRIDDWQAELIVKDIIHGWNNQEVNIRGMLRLFPEWSESHYKSPKGDIISLTLKFISFKDLTINKFKQLTEGDIFYIKGIIDTNYVNKSDPDFEGETKFSVKVEDIYSDDKNTFSNVTDVAVLITS